MFYFLFPSIMTYNIVLVVAAVLPALFLLIKVYKSDRLEKESPYLLWRLITAGIFSSLVAMILERVLNALLIRTVHDSHIYNILLYFIIVAFSEEGAKYCFLKRKTWTSSEFNCQYDGIVYAVFVSLGFALWENISYVLHYGMTTALIRALTAIPGHTCFGIFMGFFYGMARKAENLKVKDVSVFCRVMSVLIPAALHGGYDYIASTGTSTWYFIGFIIILFLVSYALVIRMSKGDKYI